MYPLHNLSTGFLKDFHYFYQDIGITPSRIMIDCNNKVIAGNVLNYTTVKGTMVKGAPLGCQNQNDMVERSWNASVHISWV